MLRKARLICPLCSRFSDSAEKVEKVLNPPQNPVISKVLYVGERLPLIDHAISMPKIKQLIKLATKVPNGKMVAYFFYGNCNTPSAKAS